MFVATSSTADPRQQGSAMDAAAAFDEMRQLRALVITLVDDLERLSKSYDETSARAATAQADADTATAALRAAEQTVGTMRGDAAAMRAELDTLRAALDNSDRTQQRLASEQAAAAADARAATALADSAAADAKAARALVAERDAKVARLDEVVKGLEHAAQEAATAQAALALARDDARALRQQLADEERTHGDATAALAAKLRQAESDLEIAAAKSAAQTTEQDILQKDLERAVAKSERLKRDADEAHIAAAAEMTALQRDYDALAAGACHVVLRPPIHALFLIHTLPPPPLLQRRRRRTAKYSTWSSAWCTKSGRRRRCAGCSKPTTRRRARNSSTRGRCWRRGTRSARRC